MRLPALILVSVLALGLTAAHASGFDYTKVANNGGDLPASAALGSAAADWACTRDNITGLTWEVKVNAATHLRHMNWTYTWYNSDSSTNGGNAGSPDTGAGVGSDNCLNTSRCDTEKFVADVNAATLCGHNDWRMPTQRELFTLVNTGAQNPSIDATYFPNTNAAGFWSASPYIAGPAAAWGIAFGPGSTFVGGKTSDARFYVRLVRSGQF